MSKLIGFIALIFTTAALADSVTLHLFKSPKGINWSTPWTMTYSTLKNSIINTHGKRPFAISHVFVEVKCDSTGEHILRGQTSTDDSNERELLFKLKYGMGVMFHTYAGKYEKEAEILNDMAPYEGSTRRGTFTALINPASCQRLLQWEREYDASGDWNMYSGLQSDPLKGEGSGCSAYAMSFMKTAGILEPFTNEWKNIIDVPKRFVGGPLTGNRVNVTKLLFHPGARWNNKEPHIHLEAWNPENMLRWVQKTHDLVKSGSSVEGYDIKIETLKNQKSVIVDLRHRATPQGPIWIR